MASGLSAQIPCCISTVLRPVSLVQHRILPKTAECLLFDFKQPYDLWQVVACRTFENIFYAFFFFFSLASSRILIVQTPPTVPPHPPPLLSEKHTRACTPPPPPPSHTHCLFLALSFSLSIFLAFCLRLALLSPSPPPSLPCPSLSLCLSACPSVRVLEIITTSCLISMLVSGLRTCLSRRTELQLIQGKWPIHGKWLTPSNNDCKRTLVNWTKQDKTRDFSRKFSFWQLPTTQKQTFHLFTWNSQTIHQKKKLKLDLSSYWNTMWLIYADGFLSINVFR